MTVIVSYDVRSDARRSRLSALLQAYGDRIQKSVFLLRVSNEELDELTVRFQGILSMADDSLYILRQCANCWEDQTCLGQAHPPTPSVLYTVL